MATMQCDVVSVQESLYSGTVTMLIAKGAGGELGIMPGHAPLVTLLQPGAIRVILENGTEEFDAKNEETTLATMSTRYASNFINDLYMKANIKDDRYLYF